MKPCSCKKAKPSHEEVSFNLMIDGTTRCNLNCSYCYFGTKSGTDINVPKVVKAIVNACSIRPNLTRLNLWYLGGEPLLAFDKIVRTNTLVREFMGPRGITVSWGLTSNLIPLNERMAELMIADKAGLHTSIDGPADIQNANRPFRNGSPSYQRVVKKVKLALTVSPDDHVRATVRPQNAPDLPRIAESLLGLGYRYAALFPSSGEPWSPTDIDAWQRGISEAVAVAGRDEKGRVRITTMGRPRSGWYCGAGKGMFALNVNGMLTQCHHLTNTNYHLIDASVASPEQLLAAVKQSNIPPFAKPRPETCLQCAYKDHCGGGCWVVNFQATGSSAEPEPVHCALTAATVDALSSYYATSSSSCNRCDACQNCYSCQSCQSCDDCTNCDTCQVCDSCQGACEKNCQSCDTCDDCTRCEECNASCQSCDGSCEHFCDNCCVAPN